MPDEKPKRPRKPKEIPAAPPSGRPGHNGGGSLNSGNTVNVGRKPSEVRAKCTEGADTAVEWLQKVARGNKVWPSIDRDGKRTLREPTGDEMMEATEKLLKYGIGTVRELVGKDGGPLQVESIVPESDALLDGLSEEELSSWRAIVKRANANPVPE